MAQAAGGGRGGEQGRTRADGEGGGEGEDPSGGRGKILWGKGEGGRKAGSPGSREPEERRKEREHYTQRLLGSFSLPR